LLARLRLPAGLLAESSNSHTERQLQPKMYSLAAFLPQRRLERPPTPPPSPRTVLSGERPAAPARSFLVEILRAARIKGSPLPPARDKVLVLPSCTTRRANLLLSDGSSGILRLGASPGSPWPLVHHSTRSPVRRHARRVLPPRRRPGPRPAAPRSGPAENDLAFDRAILDRRLSMRG